MQDFIRIHEDDNVAVALRPIALGESLTVGQYQVTIGEEIPQGHKFALLQKARRLSNTASASALQRRILLLADGCTYII